MIYSYYPGCTLKDRAKQLDLYARASAAALGMELQELPEWQCCGAVYPQASDEIASRLSAVRALMNAEEGKLVTMCSACHHVLKRTNYDWNRDENFRTKATNYMKDDQPYKGDTDVIHFLELLRDDRLDAGLVGGVDDRTHLGAENALLDRAIEQRVELRHVLH